MSRYQKIKRSKYQKIKMSKCQEIRFQIIYISIVKHLSLDIKINLIKNHTNNHSGIKPKIIQVSKI